MLKNILNSKIYLLKIINYSLFVTLQLIKFLIFYLEDHLLNFLKEN